MQNVEGNTIKMGEQILQNKTTFNLVQSFLFRENHYFFFCFVMLYTLSFPNMRNTFYRVYVLWKIYIKEVDILRVLIFWIRKEWYNNQGSFFNTGTVINNKSFIYLFYCRIFDFCFSKSLRNSGFVILSGIRWNGWKIKW